MDSPIGVSYRRALPSDADDIACLWSVANPLGVDTSRRVNQRSFVTGSRTKGRLDTSRKLTARSWESQSFPPAGRMGEWAD